MAASVIIVMGPPGAGKGTQSEILATRLGGVHLSSGQLLRQSDDPEVKAVMQSGQLVASSMVERLVTTALDGVAADRAVVLDGFVREPSDIEWLEAELKRLGRPIRAVINLLIDQAQAVDRNLKRGRVDDRPEVQQQRWQQYALEQPVLEHYRGLGLVRDVDGTGTIDEVAARIAEALA